jgi:site-specific DNA-methyltransferase (adenine-specific)
MTKMKPYWQDDWVKIYCANSRKMDFIPDNSVHLIITSPPYNVGINYDVYEDKMADEEYMKMIEQVFKECYRVLVSGGRLAVNCPSCVKQPSGSKYAFVAVKIHILLEKLGFKPREWITWCKIPPIMTEEEYESVYRHNTLQKNTSWGSWKSPGSPYLRDIAEYIIVVEKEKSILEGDKSKIDITKEEFLMFTNNVWFILPTSERMSGHPAAFPEELPYRLMKLFSYQNNVILDPFAGSGTVGVVAKKNKRKAILVDISEKYCELAKHKCSQEYFF